MQPGKYRITITLEYELEITAENLQSWDAESVGQALIQEEEWVRSDDSYRLDVTSEAELIKFEFANV